MTDTTYEQIEPPLAQQLTRVDAPMERKRVGDMVVSRFAGLQISEYREAVEFAKLMAQGKHSVPKYLKGNPGDCLAIVTQSLRWRLEPYWVAQHSYIAKDDSIIAYDSAVHAAIVLSSGLLKERPNYSFSGEGGDRVCTVEVTMKDGQVLSYTTPKLSAIIAGLPNRRDGEGKGGSPLWFKDSDQQQGYFAIRNWGRRHAPELLGGVWDRNEFAETTQDETDLVPPSPNLMERLPGKVEGAAGFNENVVDQGLADEVAQAEAEKKARTKAAKPVGEVSEAAPATEPENPENPPGGLPLRPTTADQYEAYARNWIEKDNQPDLMEARWKEEAELRASLKVTVGMRKRLDGMLVSRVDALRKEAKKRK